MVTIFAIVLSARRGSERMALSSIVLLWLFFVIPLSYQPFDSSDVQCLLSVVGHQWYWSVGVFTETLAMLQDIHSQSWFIIPAFSSIRLSLTSSDVIHSFGLPTLMLKLDAVPGRLNEMLFETGVQSCSKGACYELCGIGHSNMRLIAEIVEWIVFTTDVITWIQSFSYGLVGVMNSLSID